MRGFLSVCTVLAMAAMLLLFAQPAPSATNDITLDNMTAVDGDYTAHFQEVATRSVEIAAAIAPAQKAVQKKSAIQKAEPTQKLARQKRQRSCRRATGRLIGRLRLRC